MHLEDYLQTITMKDVIAMEARDIQFLVLQKAWKEIQKKNPDEGLFIFLVLQCALVGFQVAGSGPLWRTEFAEKIEQDRDILQQLQYNNTDRWYSFLTTSRYNKRLYNNKRKRLEKFVPVYKQLTQKQSLLAYQNTMQLLRLELSNGMQQHPHTKTMSFALKMYGYAIRSISDGVVSYPMDIVIPLDSRLRAIHAKQFPDRDSNDRSIINYYQNLAERYGIAPLHLDAAIWIDYREKHM